MTIEIFLRIHCTFLNNFLLQISIKISLSELLFLEESCKGLRNIFRHGTLVDVLRVGDVEVLRGVVGCVLGLLLDGDHVGVFTHLELGWCCLILDQFYGTTDDLQILTSHCSQGVDHVLVGGEPVD